MRSKITQYVIVAFLLSFFVSYRSPEALAATPPKPDLIVVAKLVAIEPSRGCGMFYLAEIADYSDITVLRGKWRSDKLRVLHGCTELPRSQFALTAGTLESFRVGDYHRLELTLRDIYKTGHSLKSRDNISGADYYALRVDLAQKPGGSRCPAGSPRAED